MDKKYYSANHIRNNKKGSYSTRGNAYRNAKRDNYGKNDEAEKSTNTFLLRLNICLGLAIAVVGVYRLNTEFSNNLIDTLNNTLSQSTSIDSIKTTYMGIYELISDNRDIGVLANGKEDVTLDDESIAYIENNVDSYYTKQKALEFP